MSDEEAASLCEIAYQALLMLPLNSRSGNTRQAMTSLLAELALLRNRTPEDIQNEFEGNQITEGATL